MRSGSMDWKLPQQLPLDPRRNNEDHKLQFTSDGTFQITVFSDLHTAEYENELRGPKQDARTIDVLRKVLDHETQQLVVLNGDLVTGYETRANNVTRYLDRIFEPMVEKNVPWATTYGNHDYQNYANTAELFQHEKGYKNSLTQQMTKGSAEEAGVSNYYLLVYPAGQEQDVPELILWFFDSRGGNTPAGEPRPDWVDESVVRWFEETNGNLTRGYGKSIPSLAFFHIPVAASYYFQTNPRVNASKEPGQNGEDVCWQGQGYDGKRKHDIKFMEALVKTEGLLATFSGHDHENDWCFKWKHGLPGQDVDGNGVNVCYGRHTGYGGYGHLARGGRHIVLNKDTLTKEVETWIRLEDGWIPEKITLNATYGEDEYHPPPHHFELRGHEARGIGYRFGPEMHSAALFLLLVLYLPLRLWT